MLKNNNKTVLLILPLILCITISCNLSLAVSVDKRNADNEEPTTIIMQEKPKSAPGCCGSDILHDKDKQIEATIWSQTDEVKLDRDPAEHTMHVLKMLKELRHTPMSNDNDRTVRDIEKAQHLLKLSKLLKKQLIKTLNTMGKAIPELPSEEKTYLDATGKQWANAEYKESMEDLLDVARRERLAKQAQDTAYLATHRNPRLEALMEQVKPAKEEEEKLLEWEKKKQALKDRKKHCTKDGCYFECEGSACPASEEDGSEGESENSGLKVEALVGRGNNPQAVDGTPSGLRNLEVARTVQRGELNGNTFPVTTHLPIQSSPSSPSSTITSTSTSSSSPSPISSTSAETSSSPSPQQNTVSMSMKIRYLLASPQCPCGCPRHLCPCKCQNSFIIYNHDSSSAPKIVSQLPPVEADVKTH